MRLKNKTALITGAARGIGLAFARAYLAEGAEVAIADINLEAAQKAATSLGPKAHAIALDVTRQDSIDAAFAEAVQKMGKLDILINNAALFSAAPIAEITRADYDKLFAVNVAGTLFCLQAAAKHMIPRGEGTIINMASQAGRRGEGLVAVYCATNANATVSIGTRPSSDVSATCPSPANIATASAFALPHPCALATSTNGNQCVGIAAWKNATVNPVAAKVVSTVEFIR